MKEEKNSKQKKGLVISSIRDKTLTVLIERTVTHPIYKKIIRKSSKLQVHDETNQSNKGDTVLVEECRPFSKTKSWKLVSIISKGTDFS
tara:strand:+ start:11160 stop:11426 length:267 start_codon:yes stop_codon:yes gene_type:complete